jgi:hypothetical protein
MLEALGVTGSFPGAANNAPDMNEFFTGAVTQQLNVSSPTDGATVGSQMHVVASAQAPAGINSIQIYIDGALTFTTSSATIDTMQALTPGPHNVVIKALDKSGSAFSKAISVTATAPGSISIISPAANANVPSAVHVVTSATSSRPISATYIYVDDQIAFKTSSGAVDTTVQLSTGTHKIQAQAWDTSGALFISKEFVTVQATAQVIVSSPAAGSTVGSPVHVVANGSSPNGIDAMQIYADGQLVYTRKSAAIDTYVTLAPGIHNLTVKMWDLNGNTTKQALTVNATAIAGITLVAPASGSTLGSPLHVIATSTTGNPSDPIGAMRIYVDDQSIFTQQADHLDSLVTLPSGNHRIVIVAWDQVGAAMTKSANVTVP